MASVSWTDQALGDIDLIAEFIGRDSRAAASLLVNRVFAATDQLEDFPMSGRSLPEEGAPADVRELIVRNHRVIYRLKNDEVEIVTVLHGARLLPLETLVADA